MFNIIPPERSYCLIIPQSLRVLSGREGSVQFNFSASLLDINTHDIKVLYLRKTWRNRFHAWQFGGKIVSIDIKCFTPERASSNQTFFYLTKKLGDVSILYRVWKEGSEGIPKDAHVLKSNGEVVIKNETRLYLMHNFNQVSFSL